MDDLRSGSCCSRMKYQEFPAAHGLKAILQVKAQNPKKKSKNKKPIIKKSKAVCVDNSCKNNPLNGSGKLKKKSFNSAKYNSNFCLEINVTDEARWRICHKNQDRISALHTKLIFGALNKNFPGKMSVVSNFLAKSRIGREAPLKDWHWENQNKWNNMCKSREMQSPINIRKGDIKKPGDGFGIKYNFLPVYTMMKRNQHEIITTFMNFAGILSINIHGVYTNYTPTYMSYRFPGEHTFEGKRFMGEIIIHLVELASQRVNYIIFV